MQKNGRGICNGFVYGRVPEAKYTYVYMMGIEDYLLSLLGDRSTADAIAGHVSPLVGEYN